MNNNYFERGNAKIYYEDSGSGEPIIAIHGLIENTTYWSSAGVANNLIEKYRFISMDMRGHGRTVVNGKPEGFDAKTVGEDIEALAHHLGFGRFHLLSHSTGGFASSRWAMDNSSKLASLILTNTTSATSPVTGPEDQRNEFYDKFAASFEKKEWHQVIELIKKHPAPFFRGIAETENNSTMWDLVEDMIKLNDRATIGRFVRDFYKDPDLMEDKLKNITCPVLIVTSEKDDLFLESSKIMAKAIPDSKLVILEGIGHMTAIEAPERLTSEILDFIGRHSV